MSRPPIPRQTASPRGIVPDRRDQPYFGLRFADLVALAEALARDPAGVAVPGESRTLAAGIVEIPAKDRGLARSLLEVPALLAHILGEHQSHYAAEAFLGTAREARSLNRHARRLAHEPDPGVAATGFAAFEVKQGLAGTVPLHFALQSEPRGETRSQTYETLQTVEVDSAWNALLPAQARIPTQPAFSGDEVDLPLSAPAGLDPGEIVLLQGSGKSAVCEVVSAGGLSLRLRRLSRGPDSADPWPARSAADPYRVLARPAAELRMFGHGADPVAFPPDRLANPALFPAVKTPLSKVSYGYIVSDLGGGEYSPGSALILAEPIGPQEPGAPAALVRATSAMPLAITSAREASVTFQRGQTIAIPQPPDPPAGFPRTQFIRQTISAPAGLVTVTTPGGTPKTWSRFPLDAILYADWQSRIDIAPDQPNPAAFTGTVALDGALGALQAGRTVIVERLSDGFAASAMIVRLAETAPNRWDMVLGLSEGVAASAFSLGDMRLRANVARVSHGESKSEILGSSDGVTPHQAFTLKKPGVTRIPDATGSAPELSVRVNGVLWDRVGDFHDSGPDARHYRTETDADQSLTVVFGGESRAAVPPSGSRNVTADYRTGLGRIGDAEPGRLTRIRKASPLLKSVTNPLALAGGTDPAAPDDMRRQATIPILTFDRAVSLRDYADLALLFPGVARASARWLDRGAVELIAADAEGRALADPAALRAFLDARRDTEVPLALLPPQAVDIRVTLRVERNGAWLADAVRAEASRALLSTDKDAPGLFTFAGRAFSAPQSLSGLYALLLEHESVSGVEASCFDILPGAAVRDILHATDRQWLRLLPSNLAIDVVDPGALIPQVEGDAQ